MSFSDLVFAAKAVQKFDTASALKDVVSTNEQPEPSGVRPKNAARRLGFSDATFWRKVAQGKIKVTKISERITVVAESEIKAMLAGERA